MVSLVEEDRGWELGDVVLVGFSGLLWRRQLRL